MSADSIPFLRESTRRAVRRYIDSLRRDVAAVAVLLLGPSGQLLAESGSRSELETTSFLALLGRAMAGLGEASQLLRDQEALDVHIHEDIHYNIYTALITERIFLCIILDPNEGNRIGIVWRYLRRAIKEIRALVTKDVATSQVAPPVHSVDSNELPPPEALPRPTLSAVPMTPPSPDAQAPDSSTEERFLSFEEAIALGLIDPGQFEPK